MYKNQSLSRWVNGRLGSLRIARYSWWTHWRELADYYLPRRYRWLMAPNQLNRGVPINNKIIDSTGLLAARSLAAGILSGKSSPTRLWVKFRVGYMDNSTPNAVGLWLAENERIMYLILSESNFYNSIAVFYHDLVVFGTAAMLIYEDYDNVINCYNPCLGEYYIDIDDKYRTSVFYREFTLTVGATVEWFGIDNVSDSVRTQYNLADGTGRNKEILIAHAIEPNNDGKADEFDIPKHFVMRECYWELGSANSSQVGGQTDGQFLSCRGFFERPNIVGRWDITGNDPYGRSPAMDGLGDVKQLQQETKRKGQAIDKMVNPPLVADMQLQNQPASILPGGITYVSGYSASGKPGFSSVYDTKFPINELVSDLQEIRDRIKRTFYNDMFQVASQFETRSNVTAVEWDMRKAESMVMLGPVVERIDNEVLSVAVERIYAIASRAGIFPPPPPEIAGMEMSIEFKSMLAQAQEAAASSGIERTLSLAGNLAGVNPQVMDNINIDFAIDKFSQLMQNDPKMMRLPEEVAQLRQQRAKAQEQERQAAIAEQLAKGARTLSQADVGGGVNALQAMTGITP